MLFRRHGHNHSLPEVSNAESSFRASPSVRLGSPAPSTTIEDILARSSQTYMSSQAHVNTLGASPMPLDSKTGHQQGSPPKRMPTSRKTGFATIRTDSTDSQPAFESDAFAVLMPTTRLPILEKPVTPPQKSDAAAQAEAYKTYQEKARQVRIRNNSQGLQIPSKLVTYRSSTTRATQHASMQVEASPPNSPGKPAGSFPVSPPLPQTGWSKPNRVCTTATDRDGRSNIRMPRKPVTPTKSNTSPRSYYRMYRSDSTEESSRSVSPSTPTIKIRFKPKVIVPHAEALKTENKQDQPIRPPARPSSPTKCMPNFTRQHSVEGDSLFGYKTKDKTTIPLDIEKEKMKTSNKGGLEKPTPKRTIASRLPWLRPARSQVEQPGPTTTISAGPSTPAGAAAYVDPFTSFASPTPPLASLKSPAASRPSSPKKIARAHGPATLAASAVPAEQPSAKFDSGFAQIKSFTMLLIKCGLVIYGIIAAWYILDAVREAVNTICVPFRAIKWLSGWLGIVLLWILRVGVTLWEGWGFKLALKGGWMWKMGWW